MGDADLNRTVAVAIPIILTTLLVVMFFVPVVPDANYTSGGNCDRSYCGPVAQYASLSYAYGGWGAWFQTGVNWYAVQSWRCMCPSNAVNCCIPPYADVILPVVGVLFMLDILSAALLLRRKATIATPAPGP